MTLDVSLPSMLSPTPAGLPGTRSRRVVWTGRVLTGLALAFLTWDTLFKLTVNPMAVVGTAALGYPAHTVQLIGAVEALCLVLYVVPRTAVLGAVLWTGYLGGAVATHVRLENPLFTHTLFIPDLHGRDAVGWPCPSRQAGTVVVRSSRSSFAPRRC
jgi:hypothetical protein